MGRVGGQGHQRDFVCGVGGQDSLPKARVPGQLAQSVRRSPEEGGRLTGEEGTGVQPPDQGAVSVQLSMPDARTGWRQVVCTQEAEVPGFCQPNAAVPSGRARPRSLGHKHGFRFARCAPASGACQDLS